MSVGKVIDALCESGRKAGLFGLLFSFRLGRDFYASNAYLLYTLLHSFMFLTARVGNGGQWTMSLRPVS